MIRVDIDTKYHVKNYSIQELFELDFDRTAFIGRPSTWSVGSEELFLIIGSCVLCPNPGSSYDVVEDEDLRFIITRWVDVEIKEVQC